MTRTNRCIAAGAIAMAVAVTAIAAAVGPGLPEAAAAGGSNSKKVPVEKQPGSIGRAKTILTAAEGPAPVTTQPSTIEPWERTTIYAKAEGYLSEVLVDIGDRVKKGQPLARLWIPEVDQRRVQKVAMVEQARAAVAQAQSQITSAEAETVAAKVKLEMAEATLSRQEAEVQFRQIEHDRIAQLVATRAMNQGLLDEKVNSLKAAESGLDVSRAAIRSAEAEIRVRESYKNQAGADLAHAEAQLKVAEAELKYAEILVAYAEIQAPYDGLVTARGADTGDFVTPGTNATEEPLFVMDRDEKLRIVLDVPESQSAMVDVGQPATLIVDALGKQEFTGHVARTTGVLDPRTRTLRVEVELDGSTAGLRPGMYGMTSIALRDAVREAATANSRLKAK